MNSRVWQPLRTALVVLVLVGCNTPSPESSDSASPSEPLAEAADDRALEHAAKHADPNYTCPMHPQVTQNEPGSCPICGMDLVVRDTAGGGSDAGVDVAGQWRQALNIRTAAVERGTLWRYIETVGYVGYDEDQMTHVHPRAEGWVETLKVRSIGSRVEAGDILLEYYAPEIVEAQQAFLTALRGQSRLEADARRRLELLDVPETTIERIAERRSVQRLVPLRAEHAGTVTQLGLREGMFVDPALELYTLADLSSVWVQVDVFAHQAEWIAEGDPAEIRVAAHPGRVWEGRVDFIHPEFDPTTRTLRVRLRFDNPDGALRPNMFAEATLYGGPRRGLILVPEAAVIRTEQGNRVIQHLGDGRFRPVPVTLGMAARGRVAVREGLAVGETVVVSGQFLLDSESQLQAGLGRLSTESSGDSPSHGAGHAHH